MFSRNEAAQIKKEFWTVFGQYMTPVLSAEGEKVSWLNYKTGEKDIFFRLYADNSEASVAIELTHKDKDLQQLYFEQFLQVKNLLQEDINWTWQRQATDELGKPVCRIYTELKPVSLYKKEDWPKLISFFKHNMIVLDEFWNNVRYSFEALR